MTNDNVGDVFHTITTAVTKMSVGVIVLPLLWRRISMKIIWEMLLFLVTLFLTQLFGILMTKRNKSSDEELVLIWNISLQKNFPSDN